MLLMRLLCSHAMLRGTACWRCTAASLLCSQPPLPAAALQPTALSPCATPCRPPGHACLHRLHHGRPGDGQEPHCRAAGAPGQPPGCVRLPFSAGESSLGSRLGGVAGCACTQHGPLALQHGGRPAAGKAVVRLRVSRAALAGDVPAALPPPADHACTPPTHPTPPPLLPSLCLAGTTIFSKAVVVPGQAIVPPCAIPDTVEFNVSAPLCCAVLCRAMPCCACSALMLPAVLSAAVLCYCCTPSGAAEGAGGPCRPCLPWCRPCF